jgi:LEA14-like dessication related protein
MLPDSALSTGASGSLRMRRGKTRTPVGGKRLTEMAMSSIERRALLALLACGALLSGGCAALQGREPVQVFVAGVEPLRSEGLELRMLLKLRIQNPNDLALDFNGMSVRMDVQGQRFATGVSDVGGSVPRFSETIVELPVSIPLFGIARQAIGVMSNEFRGKLAYEMTGQLAGPAINIVRFTSKGELTLPAEIFEGGK